MESNAGSACLANSTSRIDQTRCILISDIDLLGFQSLRLKSELQWDRGHMPSLFTGPGTE